MRIHFPHAMRQPGRLRGGKLVDWLTALATSIVQAAGTDAYAETRHLLGRALGRLRSPTNLQNRLEATRSRLRSDSDQQASETGQWVQVLHELLATDPSAEAGLRALKAQLESRASGQTLQIGIAGRDQYNIGGNAYINQPPS